MLPQEHFIYGLIFASFLLLIMPSIGLAGFLLIILSTVLIDFDHYVYYFFKKRDFSLTNAYLWFRKNKKKFNSMPQYKIKYYFGAWCMFHGVEALIIALVLTFFVSEYFGFIFIGMAFHLILDYIEQWPFYLRKDKISSTYDFLKFRKLKFIEEY